MFIYFEAQESLPQPCTSLPYGALFAALLLEKRGNPAFYIFTSRSVHAGIGWHIPTKCQNLLFASAYEHSCEGCMHQAFHHLMK